jgi:hypothetical protein
MSKNLYSELKKKDSYTCDTLKHGVEGFCIETRTVWGEACGLHKLR